jgi:hypothetical protein
MSFGTNLGTIIWFIQFSYFIVYTDAYSAHVDIESKHIIQLCNYQLQVIGHQLALQVNETYNQSIKAEPFSGTCIKPI